MRSENGQLLMIPQQALAQMQAQAQAQAQPQSSMGPRPATPTSAPPVQISAVQVSECPLPSFSAGTPRPAPPQICLCCSQGAGAVGPSAPSPCWPSLSGRPRAFTGLWRTPAALGIDTFRVPARPRAVAGGSRCLTPLPDSPSPAPALRFRRGRTRAMPPCARPPAACLLRFCCREWAGCLVAKGQIRKIWETSGTWAALPLGSGGACAVCARGLRAPCSVPHPSARS